MTERSQPLHERVGELQRQKHEQLERIREMQDNSGGCTFKPNIPEATKRILASRAADDTDLERAAERAAIDASRRRRIERMLAEQRRQLEHETFQPSIGQVSSELASQNETVRHAKFLERAAYYEERRSNRLKAAEEAKDASEKPTFKPALPQQSLELASARASRQSERISDKIVRLTYGDKQRVAAAKENAAAQHYSQYAFKPTVNEADRVQPTPLEDLVNNERARAAREKLRKRAEATFQEEYTFKPQIDQVRDSCSDFLLQ